MRHVLSRRSVWLIVLVVVAIVAVVWGLDRPIMANHFGYAVPGERGLPYRVHYNGRDYRSGLTCAGAGWCTAEETPEERTMPYCVPGTQVRRELEKNGSRSLVRVGKVITLFGPSHGIFIRTGLDPHWAVIILYVEADQDDCYVEYDLMGGP